MESDGLERITMIIKSIRTKKINPSDKLEDLIEKYVENVKERSILAITSKIVSICEGRIVDNYQSKDELIRKEADKFLDSKNKFGAVLTIKNGILIPTAGIDESNGNGKYILWPEDPYRSAERVRKYLINRFRIRKVGVIITDSKTTPLRWGTTGISIGHSGFAALNNYIGEKDIFGKRMSATKANIADGLAASAVLAMGEGREQTPIAQISEIPFVKFTNKILTKKEISNFEIDISNDLYSELLTSVNWKSKS